MDADMAGKLRQTARKTGLKQVDVARQAMDFGMDELVRRLREKQALSGRPVVSLAPRSPRGMEDASP